MNKRNLFPSNFQQWRLGIIYGIIAIVFGFFAIRLFDLQIIQGPSYLSQADINRTSKISVQTQRGIIYDRNGFVLARNVAAYNVVITPANLPTDAGATEEIYRQLSKLIGVPVSSGLLNDETVRLFKPCETNFGISQVVFIADSLAPYDPVRIKCNVDQKTAMIIQEKTNDWKGVSIQIEPVRDYPTGVLTSEVIGFLGPIPATQEQLYRDLGFIPDRDKVGYAGVESSLQDILGGKNGVRIVEVDAAGQELRDLAPPVQPVPGNNVRLTIDTRLQSAAKAALLEEMTFWNTYLNQQRMTSGVVIAINPKTGEILSLVSFPTYENNRMARVIPADYYQQISQDPNKPLLNHAISGEYPPGSVYKMAAAIGILNEGVVTPDYQIEDPGKITILQKFSPNDPGKPIDYVCWNQYGHGMVDYLHGVAWSCDVYWYKVGGGYKDEVPGGGLGIWRMNEYARAIGYGNQTGIELPGESNGLTPDPAWKRINKGENWATGDTYIATMGQGFVLATPLQVLVSIATLANDGKYMQPTLVKDVLDSEGNMVTPFQPKMHWDITKDPVITIYDQNSFATDQKKIVEPWVVQKAKEGMHMVTMPGGTAEDVFTDSAILAGGKTGTAEYCDNVAQSQNLCSRGNWPTHSWFVGYAPYDNPEIAVIAFVYHGGEGASVAAPIVRKVLDVYFELKTIDTTGGVEQ